MTDYMTIFSWVLWALSIAGLVLNVRQDHRSFLIWIPANIGWVAIYVDTGMYAPAALFVVYTVLSAYGYWEWRKRRVGDGITIRKQ